MSQEPPLATVVIPTRNRWRFARTAIWSALGQQGASARVIVVDDASDDGTSERLAALGHPGVAVLRQPRRLGVSAARNRGLAEVATEWVAFLDDDDVWAPFHLARLLGAVRDSGASADLAYGSIVTTDGARRPTGIRRAPPAGALQSALLEGNPLGTPSQVLVRTAAARDGGGFDEELAVTADWELWLRLARARRIAASDAVSVAWTRHAGSMHLRPELAAEELARFERRYARATGDAAFPDRCARWIAFAHRASGRRARAARWYVRSWRRSGERGDLARAGAALVGERAFRLWRARERGAIPADTAPWLGAARRVDELPAEAVPWPVAGAAGEAGPEPTSAGGAADGYR